MVEKEPKEPEKPVTYKLPPGNYVIGDVLTLAAARLATPWDADCNQGEAQYEGLPYVMGRTAHGDGLFRGSNGKMYGVDTGQLGIMDARLAKNPGTMMFGSRHSFALDVSVDIRRGVFKISSANMHIEIDTT